MIHIITTHYKTDIWMNLQRGYLEKYTSEPYNVWCGLYQTETPSDWEVPQHGACLQRLSCAGISNWWFFDINHIEDSHFHQVNYLVANPIPNIGDDDIFLFLDCDAFPCVEGWDIKVKKYLQDHDVVAVYRKEDLGLNSDYDDIPHLCFFATTRKTWIENKLLWSLDFAPADLSKPERYENPQVGMKRIEEASLKVKKLHRTNLFDAHRVCFGIYDDLVYHHSCAIRGFHGHVWEGADCYIRKNNGLEFTMGSDMAKVNAEIWRSIWNAIKEDESYTFVRRYFMGAP